MNQFSAILSKDFQNISNSIRNIFEKFGQDYQNFKIDNVKIDHLIQRVILPGIEKELKLFLGELLLNNANPKIRKEQDEIFIENNKIENGNDIKVNNKSNSDTHQLVEKNREKEYEQEFIIENSAGINDKENNDQILNNTSEKIESLSTIPLSRILFRNKSIIEVQELKSKLDKGNQILDENLIRELLDVYQLLFNRPDDRASKDLEKYLESLNSFDVKFTHATIGFFKESAPRFDIVKKHYMKTKLKEYELIKIENYEFDNDISEDMILFEICPQVYLNNEMIYPGKIIVG